MTISTEKPGFLFTLLSGSLIAGFELTCGGHAMDRIKTHQQSNLAQNRFPGVRESVQSIYKTQGIKGFYLGFRWNVVSHCGKSALRWGTMGKMDALIHNTLSSSIKESYPYMPSILLAGAVSIVESLLIVCPSESLKTKEMQSMQSFHPVRFLKNFGTSRVFDGCDAVIARQFLSWASFLIGYQKATEWMVKATHKKSSKELSGLEKFIIGAFAGALNAAIVGPIDVVKTQRQKLSPLEAKTLIQAIARIWVNHGWQAFTAGIPIKMFRASWYAGVSLFMMDKLGIFNARHA